MTRSVERPLVVLMVEDNAADVFFLREAIEASRTAADLHVAADGAEALRFLRRENPAGQAPPPDIVILDLNLPLKGGREVLEEMAADPALNTIPVAVLTTSAYDHDVCELYPAGRCLYFTKTHDFQDLQDIVQRISAHARDARRP